MKLVTAIFSTLACVVLFSKPIKREECTVCHDHINIEVFQSKSHGGLLCVNCHSSIDKLPHNEKVDPVNCSKCHKTETRIFNSSVHGIAKLKGIEHTPTCASCHGKAHDIVSPKNPASKVAKKNMIVTCGACHKRDFLEHLNAHLRARKSRMGLTPEQAK